MIDPLNPCYCTICKKPIPCDRARCEDCELKTNATVVFHPPAAPATTPPDLYSIDTRMGICPACGSRNINEIKEEVGGSDPANVQLGWLLGCFCFWPLLFVPLLAKRPNVIRRRHCMACGTVWRI